MSNRITELRCKYCNRTFLSKRSDTKYCGTTCKQYAYEIRAVHNDAIYYVRRFLELIKTKKNRTKTNLQAKYLIGDINTIFCGKHKIIMEDHYLKDDLAFIASQMEYFNQFATSKNHVDEETLNKFEQIFLNILQKLRETPKR